MTGESQPGERIAALEVEVRNLKEAMNKAHEENKSGLNSMRQSVDQLLSDAKAGSRISGWIKTAAAAAALLASWTVVLSWLQGHFK